MEGRERVAIRSNRDCTARGYEDCGFGVNARESLTIDRLLEREASTLDSTKHGIFVAFATGSIR